MDQKTQFIADYLRRSLSITELCQQYGISRKSGYKWIERYAREGPPGLGERSRCPHVCPTQTPEAIVQALIEAREHHPSWGAKKLLALLSRRHPDRAWPARSTVCDILERHGLVRKPRRRRVGHPGPPSATMSAPNAVWCADFKGQFKTRDGVYCYPLTVTDGYSRYLLGCQALSSTAGRSPTGVRASVPRVRAPRTDSDGQRRALCHDHARPPVLPLGFLGAARDLAGAYRAR
ncbi:MAG: helix-turn-helix domain-containing protein [Beggiatoa sp.]|nr:helix-turn-helix domain-containing protein [Beggiatoa sp.]